MPRSVMPLLAAFVMTAVMVAPAWSVIDPDSIVAMWLFDEGDGDEVLDVSGNEHHGRIEGNVDWIDGRFGTGIEMFGDGGVVVIPEFGLIAPETEVTITLWTVLRGTGLRDLFSFDPIVDDNRITCHFPPTAPIFQYGPATHQVTAGLPASIKEEWGFVAFAGSAKESYIRMLFNGEQKAKFHGNDLNKPAFMQSPQDWHIGGRVGDSYEGRIDEVAVFSKALSDADILRLMNGLEVAVLDVQAKDKLATSWGLLKSAR